jgi:hypothetical protein
LQVAVVVDKITRALDQAVAVQVVIEHRLVLQVAVHPLSLLFQ